ncbi:MAG TPA: glutathione S-transferase [Burkholderiaceae bacterium]|nr:glutathione S-transferase [Burkholderiaceae bacterium]
MVTNAELTFFHAPQTRSAGVLTLLEELGAPYTLHLVDMRAGEQRQPEYLAINPMGKVPAIRHGDAIVTEQVAVFLYLADLFPQAGLTPAIGEPLRGPFLRWLAFYGSSFEPAVIDRSQGHAPMPAMAPYGDYGTMLATLVAQLGRGPYILGERFSAADVLWGTALTWTTMFGLVPQLPVIKAYVARTNARPAFVRARAKDEALLVSTLDRG